MREHALPLQSVQSAVFEAITDAKEIAPATKALVRPPQNLELYADMYWLRIRDTLRDAFPKTEDLDGHVADFLREHGSNHFSLDRVGAAFAEFLGTPEAALEWARSESFVSPNAEALSFSALQAIPPDAWGDVVLELHPAVRVLDTHVVWRTGFEVFQAPINDAEREALRTAKSGAVLPDVLAPFGEDAGAAFEALRSWFNEGMVSRLQTAPVRERAD